MSKWMRQSAPFSVSLPCLRTSVKRGWVFAWSQRGRLSKAWPHSIIALWWTNMFVRILFICRGHHAHANPWTLYIWGHREQSTCWTCFAFAYRQTSNIRLLSLRTTGTHYVFTCHLIFDDTSVFELIECIQECTTCVINLMFLAKVRVERPMLVHTLLPGAAFPPSHLSALTDQTFGACIFTTL